jgi:hypothetical protein
VPRFFQGLPSYLSKSRPKERSITSTSTARLERENQKLTDETNSFILLDQVSSFQELLEKLPSEFPPSWTVITLKRSNSLFLEEISINDGGKATFRFCLSIEETLQFSMHSHDMQIPSSKVHHIAPKGKIERSSDIMNILAFLNSFSATDPQPEDVIEHCIRRLKYVLESSSEISDSLSKKLTFLVEQMNLANKINFRRYSTPFLWSALTWQKTSPALYSLIQDEGFISLPSTSHLKNLSGAFSLESGLSPMAISYLQERIKTLTEEERTVALAIDEVTKLKKIKSIVPTEK